MQRHRRGDLMSYCHDCGKTPLEMREINDINAINDTTGESKRITVCDKCLMKRFRNDFRGD